MNPPINQRMLACHWMLLRLAGWISDGALAQCRAWLAEDRLVDVALTVTHAARLGRLKLAAVDINLLAELYELDAVDPAELSLLDTADFEPIVPVSFASTRDGARIGDAEPEVDEVPADAVERALVAWASEYPRLRALWRCWRAPGDGAPYPPPVRVFVVESEQGADLPMIAAQAQRELSDAGEAPPLVDIYPAGDQPPAYQEAARSAGALLWAKTPDQGVRLAVVFDDVDPDSGLGSMRPNHQRIDDPERERIARYLSAGEPLLVSFGLDLDVVAPELGQAVPISFRTDGYWIWSDAAGYYLQRHGLAPDPGLLAHIRGRDYVLPEIDEVALHRAAAGLRRYLHNPGTATPPHARSIAECHLYMRLHPCPCGTAEFPWSRHEQGVASDGDLSVYVGSCPGCGTQRRFSFLVDRQSVAPPAFGGSEPSTIVGAEEFYALSQRAAAVARSSNLADGYDAALDAVAAVEEVLKFIPPGTDAVPARALQHDDPALYTRERLEALRHAYRELLRARTSELN